MASVNCRIPAMERMFSGVHSADRRPDRIGSQSLLGRAVEASGVGVVVTDPNLPDNPIVYVNPAFERMTGYPADEVLGRNCRFLQGSGENREQLSELREALREERECRVVLRNHRKDGASFWNDLSVSPVRDEQGRLTNFIGIQRDVTRSKQLEEERNSSRDREKAARAEAEASRARLALLAASGRVLSYSLDYSSILRQIPPLFVPELAGYCFLDVVEEDGSVSRVAEATAPKIEANSPDSFRDLRLEAAAEDAGKVLAGGRSVLAPEAEPVFTGEGETYSYMCLPLIARGRTLGGVTLISTTKERRYGPEDLAFAEDLAYCCALAMDNARLYGERSYISHTLQQSLVPHLLEIPGMEVGSVYRPVGEANEVGGDFYDLLPPNGERNGWIAVVGDICGSGAVAAAITALVRYTIRAVALLEDSPSGILSGLNEAMLRQLQSHQFCTAVCIRLEPEEGGAGVSLACGGHPEPLFLRADGSVEELNHQGKALGVFEDAELSDQTASLGAGDAIVLYTDGVTEARSPDGSFFGEERLHSLLRSCTGLTAPAIAEKIKDEISDFQSGHPHDDLAVLVLRVPEISQA